MQMQLMSLGRRPVCMWLLLTLGGLATVVNGREPDEHGGEVRTWTDASGAYSVDAAFVYYGDGVVHLRKEDGQQISVPLERLGSADRELIRQKQREKYLAERRQRRSAAQATSHTRPASDRSTTGHAGAAASERGPSERGMSERLHGITWHDSRESALAAAEQAGGKPVMWFRVLGDLKGFM